MRGTPARSATIVFTAGLSVLAGCVDHVGVPPVPGRLNFPVAAALVDATGAAGDPTHLLVLNSNFDLKYNAATFQSYDLATLEATIATECVDVDGERCAIVPDEAGERAGVRGNVKVVSVPSLLVSEVEVGSFGEAIGVDPTARHVYLPIRADEDITHIELDANGAFSCGQANDSRDCDGFHREIDRSILRDRDLTFPNEPLDLHVGDLTDFGMAAGAGHYVAVAHRSGAMTFLAVPDGAAQPVATDVASVSTATFPTLTFDPVERRFWLPTGNGGAFVRATVSLDATSTDPTRAEWLVGASVGLPSVDLGRGTASIRQVKFDPRVGTANEGRFYAVARRPAALVVGRVERGTNLVAIDSLLPLGAEPARAKLVEFGNRLLAFVTCYASRDIYVYDVDSGRLVTIARGMNGPFEIVIDRRVGRERMYVVDFRVSVVRAFDLASLVACLASTTTPSTEPDCSPRMIGMLGVPSTIEELR